jgi:hypothetical protein
LKTETEKLNFLILVFGLFLGAYARFLPTLMVSFPVTDGGLFHVMAKALQSNRYILPAFVEFNGSLIPFAYPPLGFYFTALVADIFRLPLLEAFRWIPAAGSLLFVIAFYPLASAMLKSQLKGVLATVFFALLPRSFTWTVMGGGVTRVWGLFFLTLVLWSAYQLFTSPSKRYLLLTILFGSGVIFSHPDASLHAASLCLVMWLFYGRSKEGIKNALLAALGIFLLTAPFYAMVVLRHGLSPYLAASQTGFSSSWAWLAIFTGSFAEEKFVTLISALALLGLAVALSKREFLLPVWLLLPALLDPRGAALIILIPWTMLAATAFVDIVLRGLAGGDFNEAEWSVSFTKSAAIKFTLTALIFYAFAGAVLSDQVYPKVSLSASDRAALDWVNHNIPAGSRFVIVTGETEAFADAVSEWFPALTESVSVATVQGYEWLPGFKDKLDDYYALQACIYKDVQCVENWSGNTKRDFEYALVAQDGLEENGNPLVSSLTAAAGYRAVYQKGDVAIFQKNP